MLTPTPCVIIDGSVPRNAYERSVKVFEYLVQIVEVGPHSDLDPAHLRDHGRIYYAEMWNDLEDEIIDQINDALPDSLVCDVGETNPGDVIIREVDNNQA